MVAIMDSVILAQYSDSILIQSDSNSIILTQTWWWQTSWFQSFSTGILTQTNCNLTQTQSFSLNFMTTAILNSAILNSTIYDSVI